MLKDLFTNFVAKDPAAFQDLMGEFGFDQVGCYKIVNSDLSFLVGTDSIEWPAHLSLDLFNYISKPATSLPLGWQKLKLKPKSLPKSLVGYFPEQEHSQSKIVFFVKNRNRRNFAWGELHGGLEASANRLSAWQNQDQLRHFIDETLIAEQFSAVQSSIRKLVDHEFRNSFNELLGQAESGNLSKEIVLQHIDKTLDTVQKLNLLLGGSLDFKISTETQVEMDLRLILLSICRKNGIKFVQPADHLPFVITANERLLVSAFNEVIANARSISESLQITIYQTDAKAIVELEDQTSSVRPGTEDLIFLRFYQTPGTPNKGGLGLGLFVARSIAEKHGGELDFIRKKKGGFFRFIFPLKQREKQCLKKES